MNKKKIKFYWRLYWIRILVTAGLGLLGISLIFFIVKGIRAWNEAESYLRQSQLAMIPLQLYLQIVMALIFGFVYTFLMYWLYFKHGAQSFTQASKKSISGEELGVHWNDVIGMDEAKQEALEVVKLITDRAELQRIGGKILRGILMLGPPGCGKTYLAKAIATETKLPFISMSGSEFVEMFVGVGAGRIRNLFKRARNLAELEGGCIIFIDEIDAVGAQRAADAGFGGQTETNTTLNQLLVEMDGLKEKDVNIVIVGATNMPEYFLDAALLRPGRFDRKIHVDKPNLEDRQKLFAYYLNKVKYNPDDVKIDRLAKVTVGQSPADIANIVRESALIAVRNKRQSIVMKDIDDARERLYLGLRRRIKLTAKEKMQTAYHEAGHAIVTYLLAPSKDVFKITIIPRGHTGGVTWVPEREDIFIEDQNLLLSEIKIALGSYAAEKMKFGYTTAGVSGDFGNALYTAHMMVYQVGMGKSGLLGNFQQLSLLKRLGFTSEISENTKALLDKDVQDILQTCLKEVSDLLKKEETLLDRLAQELLAKEELNYDEIEAIFKEFGKARPT
ncbi:MAG: AAA family ATPase [Candidatus Omnitrophica bacterium]|nr:AAA family ATPase [Candidatus Omnitrophota bacterium]MDD5238465.1 AAA family ATPase [Candidatus Omnitrophota bacterium]